MRFKNLILLPAPAFFRLFAAVLCLTASGGQGALAAPSSGKAPHPLLSLTLPDLRGQRRPLVEKRDRPRVLFFFCGCAPCHACARLWAQAQEETPQDTVVVFTGDAVAAQAFLAETGLDAARTTVLVDPQDRAADAYGVTVCPRAFVLGRSGQCRYTNDESGTNPQTTPPTRLVSRVITALRALPAEATPAPHTKGGRPPHAR